MKLTDYYSGLHISTDVPMCHSSRNPTPSKTCTQNNYKQNKVLAHYKQNTYTSKYRVDRIKHIINAHHMQKTSNRNDLDLP